ncbi:hypothetical protein [Streptomyces sp. 8K308]|uniref:hypothetical protein n=1 Tax=Streptomyces sp. 8K308 TaxID=2530388 RepID=UPI0014055A8A|nr:hypothetical protein [Streptomyces sp. 8K308]
MGAKNGSRIRSRGSSPGSCTARWTRIRLRALASDTVEWWAQYAVIRPARLVEVEGALQARAAVAAGGA